jgi:hypothetical protein
MNNPNSLPTDTQSQLLDDESEIFEDKYAHRINDATHVPNMAFLIKIGAVMKSKYILGLPFVRKILILQVIQQALALIGPGLVYFFEDDIIPFLKTIQPVSLSISTSLYLTTIVLLAFFSEVGRTVAASYLTLIVNFLSYGCLITILTIFQTPLKVLQIVSILFAVMLSHLLYSLMQCIIVFHCFASIALSTIFSSLMIGMFVRFLTPKEDQGLFLIIPIAIVLALMPISLKLHRFSANMATWMDPDYTEGDYMQANARLPVDLVVDIIKLIGQCISSTCNGSLCSSRLPKWSRWRRKSVQLGQPDLG